MAVDLGGVVCGHHENAREEVEEAKLLTLLVNQNAPLFLSFCFY